MWFKVKNNCVILEDYRAVPIDEISGVSVECIIGLSIDINDKKYNGYFCRDGIYDFYSTDKNNKQNKVYTDELDNLLGDLYHTDQTVSFGVCVNFYFKHTDKHIELPYTIKDKIIHLDDVKEFKNELVSTVKKVESDLIEDVTNIIYGEQSSETLTLKE